MRPWKLSVPFLILATGLASCGESSVVPSTSDEQEHQSLQPAQQPPEAPPVVTIQEQELDPAYYEWLIDGSVEIYQEEEQEDDIELNEVELNSNNIEVSAGTDVMPIDFAVVAFHEVDSRGIPIDPIGDEFNCSVGSSECSVEEDNGRIIATLQIDAEPEIIVVHITYSAYDNVEEEARHMTGSWGARV